VSLRAEQTSYILVILFGMYLLYQSVSKLRLRFSGSVRREVKTKDFESNDHDHHNHFSCNSQHKQGDSHTHHDHCCHTYTATENKSFWQSLGVILSMGLRPCTGAIMVLIYSKIVGIYWVGVSATLLMGLGTGLTVAGLGLVTIIFRDRLSQLLNGEQQNQHWSAAGTVFASFGGIFLISLGWGLFQASITTASKHPLF